MNHVVVCLFENQHDRNFNYKDEKNSIGRKEHFLLFMKVNGCSNLCIYEFFTRHFGMRCLPWLLVQQHLYRNPLRLLQEQ
jgi:hypothetical protein